MDIPAIVINLERRKDRRQSMVEFMRVLKPVDWKFVPAVDGKELLSRAGRFRQEKGGMVRLSWNAASKDDRECHHIRMGRSFRAGLTNVWGMTGCALSHMSALTAAKKYLERYGAVLILEDDVCFTDGLTTAYTVAAISQARATVLEMAPSGWRILQLGCMPAGQCRSKRRTLKNLDNNVQLCVAERCYQTHAYIVNAMSVDMMIEKLRKGFTASGAVVSIQGALSRSRKLGCFMLKPSVLLQTQSDSETCTTTTWDKAPNPVAKKSRRRKPMPSCQGKKRIPMKCLLGLRKKVGQKGAAVHAGGGSSRAQIAKKEAKVRAYCEKEDVFPTRQCAWDKWRVSKHLWLRLRREHGDQ
jgi:GR25 family glycosyltransferase involved in LPS biosynthesis